MLYFNKITFCGDIMSAVYENRDIPISLEPQTRLTTLPHLHKELEIILVAQGSTEVFADKFHSKIKKGELFISFPNQIHYYKNCVSGKYYVGIVSADVLFDMEGILRKSSPKNNVIAIPDGSPLPELFRNAAAASEPHRMTQLCGYLNLIMSEILPLLELKSLIQSDNSTLKSILDFCGHNFSANLSLDDVAENLHLSKYYISHVINRQLGLTFSDYINSLKIDEACDQLKNSNKKISDISEDVGFGSIRTFNRIFKELMGATPVEYRKQFT